GALRRGTGAGPGLARAGRGCGGWHPGPAGMGAEERGGRARGTRPHRGDPRRSGGVEGEGSRRGASRRRASGAPAGGAALPTPGHAPDGRAASRSGAGGAEVAWGRPRAARADLRDDWRAGTAHADRSVALTLRSLGLAMGFGLVEDGFEPQALSPAVGHGPVDGLAHRKSDQRGADRREDGDLVVLGIGVARVDERDLARLDRKSTRLNSSHVKISYAVFCLK